MSADMNHVELALAIVVSRLPVLIAEKVPDQAVQPQGWLIESWNKQADEFNQWEFLSLNEQLAWAQVQAVEADRTRTATLLQSMCQRLTKQWMKHFRAAELEAAAALQAPEPEGLSLREVEAQEAFTQLRDEVLNLLDGVEVNEVLGIIDNHTPEWV